MSVPIKTYRIEELVGLGEAFPGNTCVKIKTKSAR